MSAMKRLYEEIIELHEQDYTNRGIADTLGIDIQMVEDATAFYEEHKED